MILDEIGDRIQNVDDRVGQQTRLTQRTFDKSGTCCIYFEYFC